MYKEVKGLLQKSQFTNLAVFEKLFSDFSLRYYSFAGFMTAIIISKARKRLQKFSMEAYQQKNKTSFSNGK